MMAGRHSRDRAARRVAQPNDVSLPVEVVREFGDTWSRQAWHARVLSFVLLEIPTQLVAFEQAIREPLEQQLSNLERYYPNDNRIPALETRLSRRLRPEARIEPSGTASIFHEPEWPEKTVAVDFKLNGGGELSIRCRNTPEERPKLPPILLGPHTDRNAQQEAARLVRAAIALVAVEMPVPPAGGHAA
jgi:hypothetical protein